MRGSQRRTRSSAGIVELMGGTMLVFVMLLIAELPSDECVLELRRVGVGKRVADQSRPYVDCLNATSGTADHIRGLCAGSRAEALDWRGRPTLKPKVDGAIRWLDAMIVERARCHTLLGIEP